MSETHITLYGSASEHFSEIQEQMEDRRGHEISNAQVVKNLLAWAEMEKRFD